MGRNEQARFSQTYEKGAPPKASFPPQHHRLSDGLHANTQQRVDHQLHGCSRARTAEKKVLFCDRLEYWLSSAEQFRVAACHQRGHAFFGARSASLHGDIPYTSSTPG